MIFTKMHGLGNDYVCINCFREGVEDPSGFARTLCDRHYGIGADGLILICPSKVSDFKMEIYNSDGSVAGMCGNGIRCLGKYVYDYRLTGKETLSIETKSGIRNMHLHIQDGKACGAMVDMGVPRLNAHSIPILSEKEKERYDELKKSLVLELPGGEVTAANAASLTLKLSQMANGAIYTDGKDVAAIHDRKLDALEDLVESANGKSVLVAYWFKHDKDRIRERMEARELKEPQDFTDWNAGKIPVALIHPAPAGHGLNLQQGGSILIWFGLTWSLELYQQTNARLWRQGQADKTVIIQHIVAKDTIDERILNVLEHKDGTQAALIEAVKADLGMTEMGNGGIL